MTGLRSSPRVRTLDVLVASTWRAVRRTQIRRVAVLGGALGIAAAVVSASQGVGADPASVHGVVDALAAAVPLVALVIGALGSAGWLATGTAATVATWVPRRVTLAVAELIGTAVAVVAVEALVWLVAVGVEVARARAGGVAGDQLWTAVGPVGPVVLAGLLAAVVGAAVGLVVRVPAGAVLVVGAMTWFVEPATVALVGPTHAWLVPWLTPVSALEALGGTSLLGAAGGSGAASGGASPGSASSPAVVAWVWALALVTLAVALFRRRDLA